MDDNTKKRQEALEKLIEKNKASGAVSKRRKKRTKRG